MKQSRSNEAGFFISEIAQSPGQKGVLITTYSKCAADFSPGVNGEAFVSSVEKTWTKCPPFDDIAETIVEPAFTFGQLGGVPDASEQP